MKILIYNDGLNSKKLSDCFRARGIATRLPNGTVDGLIQEIVWGKPFAVIIPPEIQDGSALLFVRTVEKKLSGRKPLFFVCGLGQNLRLCDNLRKSGVENVFLSETPPERIAESVIASCESEAEYGDFNVDGREPGPQISRRLCLGIVRNCLKKNGFNVSQTGFDYTCEAVRNLVMGRPQERTMKNIYRKIAFKKHVNVHLIEQNVRNAVLSAAKTAERMNRPTVFAEYCGLPKTKEILLMLADCVSAEIRRAEYNIFNPINRIDNG